MSAVGDFTAEELRQALTSGRLSLQEACGEFLDRAEQTETTLKAFAYLDRDAVSRQAEHLIRQTAEGVPQGPLFGVPVAIKDIIDTRDMPTQYGSPLHEGRRTPRDATVVHRLREAGAIIFGKSRTTEFATFAPTVTQNPRKPGHTPGGSSSGSSAAVAAGVVPVALGTQTNGSVLRPASFCGVYGFKPSRGLLPRTGVFEQSATLDQLGVFSRNLNDAALLAQIMGGDDGHDPLSSGFSSMALIEGLNQKPTAPLNCCFFKMPWWNRIDPEAVSIYEKFIGRHGQWITVVEPPPIVGQIPAWHKIINEVEMARALAHEYHHHREEINPAIVTQIESGMNTKETDYQTAKDQITQAIEAFKPYTDRFDAMLTASALGGAPAGLSSTGDPIMQTVWSYTGFPALNLPLFNLSNGLPLGLQVASAYKEDARLLRVSRWIVETSAGSDL